jgi:hypothetical protein
MYDDRVARAVVVIALASACGRIGFGVTPTSGDASAGSDAPVMGFDTRPGIDANVIFVLQTSLVLGTLGDFGPADAACQAAASQAGLPGNYVAWLSSSTINAIDRLAGARGWVRPDGAPFADTPADIAAGNVFYPPWLRVDATQISTAPMTGTLGNGTVATAATCGNYTQTTASIEGGDTTATSGTFSAIRTYASCNQPADIYCFGTSLATMVAPAPASGRRAFVSTAWAPGGGLPSADAQCQNDAIAAGLSGQFAAALAGPTTSAVSRFDTSGAPWVRVDGVPLAATASDLFNGSMTAPLNVTAGGMYVGFETASVWSGASSPTSTTNTKTCNNWVVATPSQAGSTAQPERTFWFGDLFTSLACNTTESLYCLEL